jgi:glycosyltransferase involved in cell wall biosynthesis
MRILLVEPWLDGSHRQWAEGYQQASGHRVDIIGLPGQLWRWRLRGGSVPLAAEVAAWVERHGRPDLLLVSGLVDVAQLVGLARRPLGATPVVIYQHESQLVYPTASGPDQEAALRNWLSWCAADLVLFNSDHHRAAVAERLPAFVAQLPDPSHRPFVEPVLDRFEVLPVGLDLGPFLAPDRQPDRPDGPDRAPDPGPERGPRVVWPHRWEADKDPAAFERALAKAEAAGHRFQLILAGPDPAAGSTQAVEARGRIGERFGSRVVATGPFDLDRYRRLVASADIVVSCALQENFGIGVVEAVAAGCVPLLPDRLAYPEIIPPRWHQAALYPPGRFGTALVECLAELDQRREATVGLAAEMGRFDWAVMADRYDRRLASVAAHP